MGDIKKKKLPGNLYDPRLRYDYENRERGTVPPDTTREPFRWVSEIAYKNVHRIVARGYDTTELVEAGYGFADMIFIDFQARIPLIEEVKMLNYIMILSLEDGLSSPAAISRIVAKSNVYLTQAAGASILAFGHAYGAFSAFGNMLDKYLSMVEKGEKTEEEAVSLLVKENMGKEHFGVSNLMLKDPAAKRIFARAEKLGVARKYIPFMKKVVEEAKKQSKEEIDLDMLGGIGAAMMDLGFTPEATWAIIAVTRSYGAGAHWLEEVEREGFVRYGEVLTPKEDYDGPEERPVPSLEERKKMAKPFKAETLEEWMKKREEMKKLYGSGHSIVEEIEDPRKLPKKKK
ncbi:MAG: hypothetical protein DRP54_06610 [Spirochaetes bacterium]|nr:MAG: hypothetical protein DRP54_06610 [Spirochaetota bacterium]